MSIGNTKDNGNKGNNFPYQLKNLQLLGQIAASTAVPCCPTAATEATLLQVLNSLQQGQAFQQALVTDTGGLSCPDCPTYLEVRIWNGVSFDAPIYYDAAGNVVIPVGPVVYINPQYVLENILIQETSINAALNATRTPNILRTISGGSIAPAVYSISFYNAGTTNGDVNGATLAAGETINFDAGGNGNMFSASSFTYTASATAELLIIYVS
jgi:hypothetical protein